MAFLACACATNNPVRQEVVLLDGNVPEANCYTAVLPDDSSVHSYMLLLPGFGESVEDVLEAADLPRKAAEAGIAVFILTLQDGIESYGFSKESQQTLSAIAEDIVRKYSFADKPYCIGGFSMGGAAAVRYAEATLEKPITESPDSH